MKTRKTFIYGILAVIFALIFTTCLDENVHHGNENEHQGDSINGFDYIGEGTFGD